MPLGVRNYIPDIMTQSIFNSVLLLYPHMHSLGISKRNGYRRENNIGQRNRDGNHDDWEDHQTENTKQLKVIWRVNSNK